MSSFEPPAVPARILFVCTGNVCRSPYAEHVVRAELRRRGIHDVCVDSAGTAARGGDPAAPRILAALAQRDIDATDFRAKPVSAELVETADVVLTAEAAHRAVVTRLVPGALGRVFTVRQFARLAPIGARTHGCGATHAAGHAMASQARAGAAMRLSNPSGPLALAELVARCSDARGMGPLVPEEEDDIPDPWNRSRFAYRRATREIDVALERIIAALFPAPR